MEAKFGAIRIRGGICRYVIDMMRLTKSREIDSYLGLD